MANPTVLINGSSTTNGANVTASSTVNVALLDATGASSWTFTCIGTDEQNTISAINSSIVINQAAKTATFTAPSSSGSALIFRSTVNNGVNSQTGLSDSSLTTNVGVFVLIDGYRVGAQNETTEGNATYGWLTKINPFIRNAAALIVTPLSGDVTGPLSSNSVVSITGSAGEAVVKNVDLVLKDGSSRQIAKIAAATGLGTFGGPSASAIYTTVVGPMPGFTTSNSGIWFLANSTVSPTSTNVNLYGNGSQTILNVPVAGQFIGFLDAGSSYFGQWDTTSLRIMQGSLNLDAASGTFPALGLIKSKNYTTSTDLWKGFNPGGQATIIKQQNGNLIFGDENATSGWASQYNGYSVQINARTTATIFSNSLLLSDFTTATTHITISPAAASTIVFAAANTSNTIKQADLTTNSGTGADLTIQAQNETGTTSTGGALVLQSGTGTSTNGTVSVKAGSTTIATFLDNAIGLTSTGTSIYTAATYNMLNGPILHLASGLTSRIEFDVSSTVNSMVFAASDTACNIKQSDKTTNSGQGAFLTIQAQNETGTSSIGGNLVLQSGTGTSLYGTVQVVGAMDPGVLSFTFLADGNASLNLTQSNANTIIVEAGVISATRNINILRSEAVTSQMLICNKNAHSVTITFDGGATAATIATNEAITMASDGNSMRVVQRCPGV